MTLNDLADRVEKAEGADGELDCLIWCALNGVTDITYPSEAQEFSSSGRVEGRDAEGGFVLLGWIDPGKTQRNWQPYGGRDAYPAFTASLDAAMTLVPEGWFWKAGNRTCSVRGSAHLHVSRWNGHKTILDHVHADAATPALALCAAALRARAVNASDDALMMGRAP